MRAVRESFEQPDRALELRNPRREQGRYVREPPVDRERFRAISRCEADSLSDPRDPTGYSASDLISMGFIATPKLLALIGDTRAAGDIDVESFDAIIVAGGQSPMFTSESAKTLQAKFLDFYQQAKIACALCHGSHCYDGSRCRTAIHSC